MSHSAHEARESRALLLVGSPKPSGSASATFAAAVGSRLETLGWDTRTERITPAIADTERLSALLRAIDDADLVVLSFPVYVDSLPAPVVRLLEAWRDAASGSASGSTMGSAAGARRPPRLAVLTQCGFPEASHCDVAVEVCRLFAREVGVEWAGALAFGMGPSISGGSIERSPLAKVLPDLDLAVRELAEGRPIPDSAREAFARPMAPAWTYPLLGGVIWSREARRRGCSEPLTLRRYVQ